MWRRTAVSLLMLALLLAGCVAGPGVTLPATLAPGQLPPAPGTLTAAPPPAAAAADDARLAVPLPGATVAPDDHSFPIGQSVEGRPIWAWRFGQGGQRLVLVGGIHGGFEGNSTLLAEMLVDHFHDHPEDVLPGLQVVIIPSANPDGLARGPGLEARFNANGVDLNRNWSCDWSPTAVLQDMEIDPGPQPFSEPESQALRDYFLAEPPDAVLFYHSAVGAVFTGACGEEHPPAHWLGRLLAASTGYPYDEFEYYDVNGDASNWLAEQGVPAAIVELYTQTEPEYARNIAGVHALQCHFTSASAEHPAVRRLCADAGIH